MQKIKNTKTGAIGYYDVTEDRNNKQYARVIVETACWRRAVVRYWLISSCEWVD